MPPSPLLGAAKSDGKPFTAHLYILRPRSQHFFFLSLLNVVKFPNVVKILNIINPSKHLSNISIHTTPRCPETFMTTTSPSVIFQR